MKVPVIELMEFNVIMSIIDYFKTYLSNFQISNKNINVVSSYSDIKNEYIVPAISIEIMYRKNRSIGFGNFYADYEIINEDNEYQILEIDGTLFEYRIQFNVYSNTRGENYKWSSILDEAIRSAESGLPINTYNDKGEVIQSAVGNLSYDYAQDVKSNSMNPNIKTYDFHTIYELKCTSLQKYKIAYDMMQLGDIIGHIKI